MIQVTMDKDGECYDLGFHGDDASYLVYECTEQEIETLIKDMQDIFSLLKEAART